MAEVLVAWNSAPSGATPVESCRVPLEQLLAGVMASPQVTRGREGRFTIQVRVIEPYQGPLSAPVDIRIASRRPAVREGLLAAPPRDAGILTRRAPTQVGDFACSG